MSGKYARRAETCKEEFASRERRKFFPAPKKKLPDAKSESFFSAV